jgi:hypothetical protein
MNLIRAVLSTALGALVIWLTVKLINRRKKIGLKIWISAPVLYCLSIGPMGRVAQEAQGEWMMYG